MTLPTPAPLAGLLAAANPPPTPGGLSDRAHVFVAIVALGSLLFTLRLVRRHRLRSKYSLLWLAIVLLLAPLAIFPDLLDRVSVKLGVSYPPATFLTLSTAFLFLVVMHFSWELSRLEERSRTLAEEIALLRAELDARAPAPPDGEPGPRDAERPGDDGPRTTP